MALLGRLDLVGGGGEGVDFRRVLASHGVATLAPFRVDLAARVLEATIDAGGAVRTITLRETPGGQVDVAVAGRSPGDRLRTRLLGTARHVLRLDEDLSDFYARCAADPSLAWAAAGAGRMMRSPTVFEDVVKTICTTNCAWSATVRMTDAVVAGLGPASLDGRHAFPAPDAMAAAGAAFYQEVARAGYRGAYLLTLARDVADGRVDLEVLADPELPDAEVESRLLALPGVGPYAAAHIMLVSLGRYGRLVLDSWTRPTYAALCGRPVADKAIERRFRRYGRYAGLAFWLRLTEDWVETDV
ncbi:MAG: DNA-3-methyladenine glycosylase family protein [Acidimicrobiales bacterium]